MPVRSAQLRTGGDPDTAADWTTRHTQYRYTSGGFLNAMFALLEATLALMPPEAVHRMSSLTGRALYYMGTSQLQHKILSVAEEAGVAEAAYALKLLQSDGRLRIATVGKDSGTGRPVTQHYEVEGPVAMLLTTTAQRPDEELANRCLVVSANEQAQQTAAIHRRQRSTFQQAVSSATDPTLLARHQNAQRLLQPLPVIIPWADRLTFRTDHVRYRRDHAKYLSLIASIALLHQYQRQQIPCGGRGSATSCVVASLHDLVLANQLATAVLSEPVESLLVRHTATVDRAHPVDNPSCPAAEPGRE